jgi:hypothetical protein
LLKKGASIIPPLTTAAIATTTDIYTQAKLPNSITKSYSVTTYL